MTKQHNRKKGEVKMLLGLASTATALAGGVVSTNVAHADTIFQPAATTSSNRVTNAQVQLNQAQKAADIANNNVTVIKQTVDQANQQVNQAQAKVDSAKQALQEVQAAKSEASPTKIAETQQLIKDQTQAVKDTKEKATIAQEAIMPAQKNAKAAQEAVTQASNNVEQANKGVTDAQQKVNDLEAAINNVGKLKDAVAKAQANVKTAQDRVATLQASLKSSKQQAEDNKIVMPEGYYQKLFPFGFGVDNEKKAMSVNHYKHNEVDKKTKINPTKLTQEQQRDLSLWVANLLNSARQQLGAKNRLVVTENALKLAKTIADNYYSYMVDDYINYPKTKKDIFEDSPWNIDAAYKKVFGNVEITKANFDVIGLLNPKITNLDALKSDLYNTLLIKFFNNDYLGTEEYNMAGFDDALNLLGRDGLETVEDGDFSFGVAIDQGGLIHLEGYSNKEPDTSTHYVATTDADNGAILKQELDTAKNQLKLAQDEAKQAENNLKQAAASKTEKRAALQQAQRALTKIQAQADKAKADLEAKRVELQSKEQILKAAQAKANQADQAVKDAQGKLDALKHKLDLYQNADQLLVQAQRNLATAQAELTTAQDQQTQTPAASADQQLSNLKSQQTANENKVASSNAATMSAASDAANKQIADLNNQIVQRQNSDVASYQSEIASVNNDAKKATDAENASYSDAVTKQKAANDSELKSAQANIVTEQQKAQETKKENADFQDKSGKLETTHKQNLSKIDKDSQSATDEINGKIQKEIDKQKADYSQAIVDATKQVDAKINDANIALNQAQKAVNDDKADVNTKQSADDQAQSALKNAKQNLTSAQAALKQAQANQPVVNNINVSNDFINAWKEYTQIKKQNDQLLSKSDYPKLFSKLEEIDKQELKMNAYKSDPIAKQTKVTLTANGTLSRDDIIKATQYAVQLLNPLRKAIGTDPYKITNASVDIAQDVENGYREDHFNMWTSEGHDVNRLSSVAKDWDTDFIIESWAGDGSFGSLSYDENTGKFVHDYSNLTLDDLQHGIYDSILLLLFKDSAHSFGHATDILGVRMAKADYVLSGDKLGVGFDYGKGEEGWGQVNVGGFHFDTIADATSANVQRMLKDGRHPDAADPNSKVNQGQYKEEIAIPKVDHNQSLQDLQTKVANDTQAVNDAQNKADASASALKDAKAKLDSDSTKLTQAQSKLNDLKANRDETIKKIVGNPAESPVVKKLQDQLTTVKNKHDENVKAENQQYEAQLSDLKKNHEANLAKIAAQPTNVDELKSQLQAKLDSLKKDHEAKLAQIQDEANAKIADIKKQASANDPEIDKLQAKISEIKDNLAQQQKALDDQFAALKAKDEAEYNDLKSKLEGSSSETVKGNNNHYNTSDGQHEVILPSDGNSQASSSVATNLSSLVAGQSSVKVAGNATAQNTGKALPQTGSEAGVAAILLGAMSAMFSFGFAAKKRY